MAKVAKTIKRRLNDVVKDLKKVFKNRKTWDKLRKRQAAREAAIDPNAPSTSVQSVPAQQNGGGVRQKRSRKQETPLRLQEPQEKHARVEEPNEEPEAEDIELFR